MCQKLLEVMKFQFYLSNNLFYIIKLHNIIKVILKEKPTYYWTRKDSEGADL